MRFPYEMLICLRYLRSKRSQRTISSSTLISIGGITIGAAALIATLAVIAGYQEDLKKLILGTNAHIVIVDRTRDEMGEYNELIVKIKKVPHVVAAAPAILRQALLSSAAGARGVVLRGIDPESEAETTEINKNLVQGRLMALTNPSGPEPSGTETSGPADSREKNFPGIVIGTELAANLKISLGDTVNIISPVGKSGNSSDKAFNAMTTLTPKVRKFKVVGIFSSGMFEYDSSLIYVSIKEAQNFFNLPDVVTAIQVKVDDIYLADEVSRALEEAVGFPFSARDWMKMNRNLFLALQQQRIVLFVIVTIIIFVASFNVVSTLTMTVVEKTKEIAILKAMGAKTNSIMVIFMLQGIITTFVGVVLGIPNGIAICMILRKFYSLPGDIYYISHFPMKVQLLDVSLVTLSAVLIGFITTVYPSWRAAKLSPADALR